MKLFVLSCVPLLLLVGCSTAPQMDYSKADLVEVTGTVTMDGAPLAFAVLSFDSPDGQFSYAMTDEAGSYRLQFDMNKTGCTKGPKVVQISTSRKILGLNVADEGEGAEEEEGEGGQRPSTETVPACYNKESVLTAEVSASKTTFDFDLKSEGV